MDKKLDGILRRLQKLDTIDRCIDMVVKLEGLLKKFEDRLRMCEEEQEKTRAEVERSTSSAKRYNVILYNIEEQDAETDQDILSKVLQVFKSCLGLENVSKSINSVRRVDKEIGHRARPVRIKFSCLVVKMQVAQNFKMFKNTPYNASEDFTKEVMQRRKKLLSKMHRARKSGKQAVIKFNCLYVNGKQLIEVEENTVQGRASSSDSSADSSTDVHRKITRKKKKIDLRQVFE